MDSCCVRRKCNSGRSVSNDMPGLNKNRTEDGRVAKWKGVSADMADSVCVRCTVCSVAIVALLRYLLH